MTFDVRTQAELNQWETPLKPPMAHDSDQVGGKGLGSVVARESSYEGCTTSIAHKSTLELTDGPGGAAVQVPHDSTAPMLTTLP